MFKIGDRVSVLPYDHDAYKGKKAIGIIIEIKHYTLAAGDVLSVRLETNGGVIRWQAGEIVDTARDWVECVEDPNDILKGIL